MRIMRGYYRGVRNVPRIRHKDVLEHGKSRLWNMSPGVGGTPGRVREPRSSPLYARTSIELDGRAAGRRRGGLATLDGTPPPPCHSGPASVQALELVTGEG